MGPPLRPVTRCALCDFGSAVSILQSAGFAVSAILSYAWRQLRPCVEMIKVEPVNSTDLNERLAYSVDEAAAITDLSRDLMYDQMRAGKLAYLKVGWRRIITRLHLEAFLAGTT